jgi:hypothetical protein
MRIEPTETMKWSQPKLDVLARTNPEEAVLASCKHKKANPMNPKETNVGCINVTTLGCGAACNRSMSS